MGDTPLVMLSMGVELSGVHEAGKVVVATMGDLNRLTDQYQQKTASAMGSQLSQVEQLARKVMEGAIADVRAADQRTAAYKTQNEELTKQIKLQDTQLAGGKVRIGQLEQELLLLRRQGEEVAKHGGELSKATGGLLAALTGSSMAGQVATGVLAGGGIGVVIRAAVEGLKHFLETMREVTKESSKLTQVENTFRRMAEGARKDPNAMLAEMQAKTEGLVSRMSLMQMATKAMSSHLGVSTTQMADLAGALVKLSEAKVTTATPAQAIERLTQSFARGRPEMLAYVAGLSNVDLRMINLSHSMTINEQLAARWQYAIKKIIDEANRIGDVPMTLEGLMERLSVSWKDLLLIFGEGFNLSPGMQLLGGVMKTLLGDVHSLEGGAERLGQKFGNAFSLLVLGIQGAFPALKNITEAVFHVLGAVGDVLGPAFGTGDVVGTQLREQTRSQSRKNEDTIEKAKRLHPAMMDAVTSVLGFTRAMDIATGLIELITRRLSDQFSGKAPLPSSEDELERTFDKKRRKYEDELASIDSKREANPHLSDTERANLDTREREISRALAGMTSEKRETLKHMRLPQSADAVAAQADKRYVTSLITAAQGLTGSAVGGVIPSSSAHEPENRQLEEKQIDERRKVQDAIVKVQKAGLVELKQLQLADIQDQKRRDEEGYKNGEESLEQHLATQKTLIQQAHRLQDAIDEEDFKAKVGVLRDQFKDLGEKRAIRVRVFGPKTEEVNEIDTQLKVAYGAYLERVKEHAVKVRQENSALQKDLLSEDEQGDQARIAEAKKNIDAQLKQTLDSIQARKAAVTKSYQQMQMTPEDYTKAQLLGIELTEEAERQHANATYAAGVKNPAAEAARLAEIALAVQKAKEQAAAVNVQAPIDVYQRTAQLAQMTEQKYQGAISVAQAQQNQEQVRVEQERYRDSLVALIPTLQAQRSELQNLPLEWAKANQLVDQYLEKLAKINIELRANPLTAEIGSAASILSSALGAQNTKFMQNLSQVAGKAAQTGAAATKFAQTGFMTQETPLGSSGYHIGGDVTTQSFIAGLQAAVSALASFISTITSAKSAIAGAFGGGVAGMGIGSAVGPAMTKAGGALGSLGPYMGLITGTVGALVGALTGSKTAQVINQINDLNISFKNIMQQFALNTDNLQWTITQLQGLLATAQQEQASSKKGSAQYQQTIDQYNDQIKQLQAQQNQIKIQMDEQVAILSEPIPGQGLLSNLQQIVTTYDQFAGAAQNATELAEATDYLTQSIQAYEYNLGTQLLQDNEQAIQDAIQLNDLTLQRQQMVLQFNDQVQSIMSQGVLTRQQTRAQSIGEQIQQLNVQYQQQLQTINEQIAADTYKVQTEQQVFNLATTRIGLELQLLAVQNAQTDQSMAQIAALQSVIAQLTSGNYTGAVAALLTAGAVVTNPAAGINAPQNALQALQGVGAAIVSTPASQASNAQTSYANFMSAMAAAMADNMSNSAATAYLEALYGSAYADRASMGYGGYQGQGL